MFYNLSEVPEPIKRFYIEEDGVLLLIPFGEIKSQQDVELCVRKHATQSDKHWIITKYLDMYWEGFKFQYHQDYLYWFDLEKELDERIATYVPELNDEGEVINSLEDFTKVINDMRKPEPVLLSRAEVVSDLKIDGLSIEEFIFVQHRLNRVDTITVEVDGLVFDGDEDSQRRMLSAITAAETLGLDKTKWRLFDNSVVEVTKLQLVQAHAKAILKQGELWIPKGRNI